MPKLVLDSRMISLSGIGRYVSSLIPIIKNDNHYELVLLGRKEELEPYGVEVIPCKSKIYSPMEQMELWAKIPRCEIFWSPHFNAPLMPIQAGRRVVTIHDVFQLTRYSPLSHLKKQYARILIKNAVRKSDAVFTISQFTKDELERYLQLDYTELEKIHIVYRYQDKKFYHHPELLKLKPDILSKYNIPGRFILFVGNIKPHKNIEGLLKAFALIKDNYPDCRLLITGQKDNFITGFNNISGLLAQLSLNDSVVFTGVISDSELISLYHNAEVLILPSFYEGFGLPPLEAMACGCPAIVSDIPVLREIYGSAAHYIDPLSPESIAEGFKLFLDNDKTRKDFAAKGMKKAEEYTEERAADGCLRVLSKLQP